MNSQFKQPPRALERRICVVGIPKTAVPLVIVPKRAASRVHAEAAIPDTPVVNSVEGSSGPISGTAAVATEHLVVKRRVHAAAVPGLGAKWVKSVVVHSLVAIAVGRRLRAVVWWQVRRLSTVVEEMVRGGRVLEVGRAFGNGQVRIELLQSRTGVQHLVETAPRALTKTEPKLRTDETNGSCLTYFCRFHQRGLFAGRRLCSCQ